MLVVCQTIFPRILHCYLDTHHVRSLPNSLGIFYVGLMVVLEVVITNSEHPLSHVLNNYLGRKTIRLLVTRGYPEHSDLGARFFLRFEFIADLSTLYLFVFVVIHLCLSGLLRCGDTIVCLVWCFILYFWCH